MGTDSEAHEYVLHEWIKLKLHDPDSYWTACTVCTIIMPGLCAPVILGLPFLVHNTIVVDHAVHTVIDKTSGFDLLYPITPPVVKWTPLPCHKRMEQLQHDWAALLAELKIVCAARWKTLHLEAVPIKPIAILATVQHHIDELARQQQLLDSSVLIKTEFCDLFEPIPHLTELPTNVYCRI